MKTVRSLALAAVSVAGMSAIASAQITNPAAYSLDLTLTLRSVSANGTLTDVQTGGTVNATTGSTYRLELRYRINDGALADNRGARGLTSASIRISNDAGVGISRSGLSLDQFRSALGAPFGPAPVNPDSSAPDNFLTLGLPELGGGIVSGMADPYRGGIGSNDNAPANGVVQPGGVVITPLSLAAPAQNSFTGLLPNNNNNGVRWALYSFEFTYTGGTVNFTASAVADGTTGNRFAFWSGETTPTNSSSATDGTISFIPAPGAAALLGLGGLVAARRRRA